MKKMVSGGQTGSDQAGLSVAKALGLETGGCKGVQDRKRLST